MNDQEKLDIEIKKMRLDYDIAGYTAQIIDAKRKLLELKREEGKQQTLVRELEDKILAKGVEKENLGS